VSSPLYADCTIDCERAPDCTTCGKRKQPVGRDAGVYTGGSYCTYDCPDYRSSPTPGHLWPGELKRIREEEAGEVAP